jgi:hypothetical protein
MGAKMTTRTITDVLIGGEEGNYLFQGATARAVEALRSTGHTLHEGTTVLLNDACDVETLYEFLWQRGLSTGTLI